MELWSTHRKTALLVTHDVDEALLLADRVVMMTNGPEARVGEILDVPFARPRCRATVLEDPRFDELRGRLLGFLAEHEIKDHDHSEQDRADKCEPEVKPRRELKAAAMKPRDAAALPVVDPEEYETAAFCGAETGRAGLIA